ncbi:hypothetical protein [Streptomyces sp. 1114.5]|uniref:hypothetical protein n=1 Tax=Streptomyces sp. 1114.5 TaxID=1938830 RepID=UPI0011C4714E|nr:hypothetical protein [Streptomyces sp. 1114.5]
MSEPMEFEQAQGRQQGPQQGRPEEQPGTKPVGKARRARRWLRGRPVRWVAAGAAVVVVAGGAAVAAHHVAGHHGEHRGDRKEVAAADHGHGGYGDGERGEHGQAKREHPGNGGNGGNGGRQGGARAVGRPAPAPLPSTDAADAVAKAAAAVAGGKVESLSPVTEQGGGRAWQAVVLGPDGVRHLVTLDGTSGAITGNTVLGR